MKLIKENDLNLLRDFSSIFSRSELNLMLKGNFSSLNLKIDRYSQNIPTSVFSSYLNFVKYAYKSIEKSYQNEYVLKNSFLTYWLIDELGKSDTVVLNEFRVGNPEVGEKKGDTDYYAEFTNQLEINSFIPAFFYRNNNSYIFDIINRYNLTNCLIIGNNANQGLK